MRVDTTRTDFARLAPPAGSRMLVVGGCGAIGSALVSAGLDMGLEVAIFALLRSLAAKAPPAAALSFAVDATDEMSVSDGYAALAGRWDRIDTLVYTVGFMTVPPRAIDQLNVLEWEAIQSGNLRSAFLIVQGALPLLRASENASIVNVGSSLAYNPLRGVSAYASAKAGLVALTKSLAIENAPRIRANVVAPSAVDTPFLAGGGGERGATASAEGGDAWFRNMRTAYEPTIPMGRIATTEDIVGPIFFLAGPSAAFITGQVLHVNGGRVTP
jgi:NAD(P)-dependent dehydrogenase (short-subunit alcohol dehydrogenase family)